MTTVELLSEIAILHQELQSLLDHAGAETLRATIKRLQEANQRLDALVRIQMQHTAELQSSLYYAQDQLRYTRSVSESSGSEADYGYS